MSKQQTPHLSSIPASEPPSHVFITLMFSSFLRIAVALESCYSVSRHFWMVPQVNW